MIKIAICDDDIKTTSMIEKLIYKYEAVNKFDIDVCFSGESLLLTIKTKVEIYDLIFLDVEMGELNGIDIAHEIRKVDKNCLIIYITAYVKFAPSAFEVDAFRFLSKPINEDKFEKYYHAAINKIIKIPKYFRYTFKKENFKILISDIMYFESNQRISLIKSDNKSDEKCYMKLNNIEQYLTDNNIFSIELVSRY